MNTPRVSDLSAVEAVPLGQPFAVFRGSKLLSMISLIVGPLGVFLIPGATIVGYVTGGVKEGSPAGPIMLVLSFLMALAGGYLIYAGLMMRQLRYELCPGGIARYKGQRVEVLPWNGLQITVHFHGHPLLTALGTSNKFWIKNDSRKWSVHYEVANSDKLAKAVSEEIVRRNLDPALERITQGQPLEFGPIRVDRNGITLKDRTLSWEQVSSIGAAIEQRASGVGRRFSIKQIGNDRDWGSVEERKVPNFELLFALIRKLRPEALSP
jgi:hypothetical protein